MSKTTQEAFQDLDSALKDFKATVLNEFPFLKILPSIADKKGSIRLLVCIAYIALASGVIDATAWLISLFQ